MKAVTYSSTGSSDVLNFGERDEPHPAAGEVRVRIHVSGVNPTDWKARQGSGEAELPQPQVPDQDGAGVVDEIGDGVTGIAVGDRLWVWDAAYKRPDGTAQELAVVPAGQVVPPARRRELRRRGFARHPGTHGAPRLNRVKARCAVRAGMPSDAPTSKLASSGNGTA